TLALTISTYYCEPMTTRLSTEPHSLPSRTGFLASGLCASCLGVTSMARRKSTTCSGVKVIRTAMQQLWLQHLRKQIGIHGVALLRARHAARWPNTGKLGS